MAFEKAKVLKAAEKFLSQGKISAAIKEYRRIVESDDSDLTTLNMLGDLCVRAGQNDEAISCFSRIAEHYREQEFTLKAIAMYKKIERLKPRDPIIASRLAALYAAQGLGADARAQYLIVADALTRAGKTIETLEILHKVADLDPKNTEIRLKLAEGYLKENLQSPAGKAFMEAATNLFEAREYEQALSAYTKAFELRPNDDNGLKGVVASHIELGSADEAAELLERIVSERSEDQELVSLLARTYIAAEDPAGAERATATLVQQDSSNYIRFVDVARLYLKTGDIDEATRVLTGITEQSLAGREENELLELVNEVLARNPEHVSALRLLVRIHWWQRDMENLRLTLERLAEAAEAAGLNEDERYALTQLVRLSPEEQRYADRLSELGGMQEDLVDDGAFPRESSIADAPSFETFDVVGDETSAVPDAGVETSPANDEFEWHSFVEPEPAADPSASFADLNENSFSLDDGAAPQTEDAVTMESTFEFGSFASEESVQGQTQDEGSDSDDARRQTMIRQELESVDFYIAQGYVDIAVDTLDLMEKQFGLHPEIVARRSKLEGGAASAPAPAAEAFDFGGDFQSEKGAPEAADTLFATVEETVGAQAVGQPSVEGDRRGIDAGLAEVFEEFRLASEDEPAGNEDFETHYNMGIAYKEMDLLDEAVQEFQLAAGLAKSTDGTPRYLQCCNMLGHCFAEKGLPRAAVLWFKKGLESPGHSEHEYKALRYELGLAYEQMGDLHRAFDLFTEVYGIDISYRGVADKLRDLEAQKQVRKRRKS